MEKGTESCGAGKMNHRIILTPSELDNICRKLCIYSSFIVFVRLQIVATIGPFVVTVVI